MEERKIVNEIDYLCIGHCCHDKTEDGYILGGTASYAALVGKQLGKSPAILTSLGDDFEFFSRFQGLHIQLHNKLARNTTVFENIYKDGGRIQYIHERADVLTPSDVPPDLKGVPLVHLCLIADEIEFSIVEEFDNALVGATIQGCLRQWDSNGLIRPKEMNWDLLSNVDIVIFSDDDIRGFESSLPKIKERVDQVVLTQGANGAIVFKDGNEFYFPSFPVKEVEVTGAGDVFTTAYLIEYERTSDIASACIFAHCAASFVVEGVGLANLPTLDALKERIATYNKKMTV